MSYPEPMTIKGRERPPVFLVAAPGGVGEGRRFSRWEDALAAWEANQGPAALVAEYSSGFRMTIKKAR